MNKIIIAHAFVFGKNIDTDQILPGRFLELVEPEEIGKHCMEGADPNFIKRIHKGDIIVANTNFGCGSSREHAPIALLNAGISLVIAESFARIFYRNSLNLALPLLVCHNIHLKVHDEDLLEVNIEKGIIINKTTNQILECEKITPYVLNIIENGGIKPLMKKRTASGEFNNIGYVSI